MFPLIENGKFENQLIEWQKKVFGKNQRIKIGYMKIILWNIKILWEKKNIDEKCEYKFLCKNK